MSELPPWVWINGEFRRGEDRAISPFDRGLTGGDALYETLLGFLGEPQHFEDHWSRLTASAEALEIPVPVTAMKLEGVFHELIDRCALGAGRVRLKAILTRGASTTSPWNLECERPTLIATAWEAPPPREVPLTLETLPFRRDAADPIWRHKTVNVLSRGIARAGLQRRGVDDGLILNMEGRVCEATTSNIFAMVGERIVTPPLEEGLLPGTVRARLLRALREVDACEVVEEPLTRDQLLEAEVVWLTNVISLVTPVGRIDGVRLRIQEAGKHALELAREVIR
ncbi:aminotransferase class IV [Candidatus Sumerlaeota bacterium]|nr:aminotransferase class IV [Candidatus Sumerlaeota bacterium]